MKLYTQGSSNKDRAGIVALISTAVLQCTPIKSTNSKSVPILIIASALEHMNPRSLVSLYSLMYPMDDGSVKPKDRAMKKLDSKTVHVVLALYSVTKVATANRFEIHKPYL